MLVTDRTDHDQPSVFAAEAMLRETRRQRQLPAGSVPTVCVLDPDGDIFRHIQTSGGTRSDVWACYHTELWQTEIDGSKIGVIGCAVGAPYAVLIAEQLAASGCQLLVSITSAGQLSETIQTPCFVLITDAIRGEGTSHCYLPAAESVSANAELINWAESACANLASPVVPGVAWTTDAPYRETHDAVLRAQNAGAMVVEMESAALYAFAQATGNQVICFAHVTNQMGQSEGDFEKGENDGVTDALNLITALVGARRLSAANR